MDSERQRANGAVVRRVEHTLPSVWPGYVLAGSFMIAALGELFFNQVRNTQEHSILTAFLVVANTGYWLFCIFRIHGVLAEATGHEYPIGPRKAIGYMFIPFFNIYWLFHWTNRLADFVNQQPAKITLRRYWPGIVMFAGLMISASFDAAVGLPIQYGAMHYVRHKLGRSLAPSFPDLVLKPSAYPHGVRPRRVAISAAIGSAFGFILWRALLDFWRESRTLQVEEAVAVVVVTILVMGFIEPLLDWLRTELGLEQPHAHAPQPKSIPLRLMAFVLIILASVSHALLHLETMRNPGLVITLIFVFLIIPGGITYAWTRGALWRPSRCAQLGALWGLVLGTAVVFIGFTVGVSASGNAQNLTLATLDKYVIVGALPWPLMGYAGGWVLDRHPGPNPSRRVALAIIITMTACDVVAFFAISAGLLYELGPMTVLDLIVAYVDDLTRAAGWALGLIVIGPAADLVLARTGAGEKVDRPDLEHAAA